MNFLAALSFCAVAAAAAPAAEGFRFDSIDGGEIALGDYRGHPVLVVNTASECGFTPQYEGLQTLYDRYRDRGLVVLAIPSDDFKQELDDAAAVKEFCDVNFGLTLPMTGITRVKGPQAHPFYRWLETEHGFTPGWNFNKVLLGPEGNVVATYGAFTKPLSAKLARRIEGMLN
ncbi:glutathione peroxidase [Rhodovulum bhavnagarense]|uniref:glutathione peroxidase n=1 Tax=Rhodovulum bhavnagarense TaxID=992286 RepID=UPI003C7C9C85